MEFRISKYSRATIATLKKSITSTAGYSKQASEDWEYMRNAVVIANESSCFKSSYHLSFYRGEVILLLAKRTSGQWTGHWTAKSDTSYGLVDITKVTKIDFSSLRKKTSKIVLLDWLPYFLSGTFFIYLTEHKAQFVYNNYGSVLQAELDLGVSNNDSETNDKIQDFIWKNRNIFRFYVDDESVVYCNQFLGNNRSMRRNDYFYPYIPDWYHGYVGKGRSNRMLNGKPTGCFIVGKERRQRRYILSVTDGKNIFHIPTEENNGSVVFVNTVKKYDSVVDLIEYCFSVPMFIENDGEIAELYLEKWISRHDKDMPDGLSTLDPYWTELYLNTLLEGKEKQRSVRLMVVGHEGVGKTTLTRNLMDRSIEGVETTNGIEVHVKTCLVENDGKWKESETENRDSNMIERIARMVQSNNNLDKESDQSDIVPHNEVNDTELDQKLNFSINSPTEITRAKIMNDPEKEALKADENISNRMTQEYSSMLRESYNGGTSAPQFGSSVTNENARAVMVLSKSIHGQVPDRTVSTWDFGGQFVFYATHQLFHSPRAVYLLVLDLSKGFDDVIDYGNPVSCRDDNRRNVQTFVKFWMHSIHTFASSKTGEPPVILVGTHRDKIDEHDMSKDEHAEKYFDDVRALFEETPLLHHIQPEQFFLDNLEPKKVSLDHLKSSIIAIAARQSFWNQEFPAKWIPIEQALSQVENRPYISFSQVCEMDSKSDVPVANIDEIRLFLMYHHFQGFLIYFNEDDLMDYVILNPQWLIDAFKCIITSGRFCKVRTHLRGLWHDFENTAILKTELIEEVWKGDDQNNFLSDREMILKFLVRLGIMSKGRKFHEDTEQIEELDYYLVPSLLPVQREGNAVDTLFCNAKSTALVVVIKFDSSYISPTIYHRVTAASVGKWAVVESCGTRLLYSNVGVYRLDIQHVGLVRLTDKTLELSVHNLCGEPIKCKNADSFRRFISKVIKHELNRFHSGKEARITTMFRCKCSRSTTKEYVTLEMLQNCSSLPCLMSVPPHTIDSMQVHSEWFVHAHTYIQRGNGSLDRTLGNADIVQISKAIGLNWKLLGISLGIPSVELERIQMDHPHSSVVQIMHMLQRWQKMAGETATMETLVEEMKANPAVRIDWDVIKDVFDTCDTEVKQV